MLQSEKTDPGECKRICSFSELTFHERANKIFSFDVFAVSVTSLGCEADSCPLLKVDERESHYNRFKREIRTLETCDLEREFTRLYSEYQGFMDELDAKIFDSVKPSIPSHSGANEAGFSHPLTPILFSCAAFKPIFDGDLTSTYQWYVAHSSSKLEGFEMIISIIQSHRERAEISSPRGN